MDDGARYLIAELERLLTLPLDSQNQIETWYAESKRMQRELSLRYPDFEHPHEIWHFLADADLRARDPGYRQSQEKMITDYIWKTKAESDAV